MALQIENLFNHNRLRDVPSLFFILLLMYFPIGIVLMVLRILISFQFLVIMAVLPKGFFVRKFILRMYLVLIGIPVTTSGLHNKKGNPNVVVSNYISYLDSIVIESVVPTQRLSKQINLPGLFKWLFGFIEDDTSCMGLETVDYEYPLSFFPEEDSTNGMGLLKFNQNLFKISGLSVQPIALYTSRPMLFPAHVHCLASSFWSDLFWTLFFPFTHFHISHLPARETPGEESDMEEFLNQLQSDIAGELSILPSSFTSKDKSDFVKRLAHEKVMRERNLPKVRNTGIDMSSKYCQMAKQVKAVLPQVPMSNIESEVKRTRNVDVAISRFLDGTVKYKPLTEEEQQNEKDRLNKKKREALSLQNSMSLLTATSSTCQQLSFQERKELMIAEARAKYLQLHPEYA